MGEKDIWFATRDTASMPFGTPQLLPAINSAGSESELHLSTNGCELFFGRLAGGLFFYDLFQTRLTVF